ncbi:hypothetical protein FKV24_002285 [Lysobacter maris]|uniref:Apea-like HEPN domain-containing protein n=1 Tax=Marilutibacter maris TaxID=1605891 RepID=A0A508B8U9_9GAMM|nr:hypothetical protein [Lysobacter maris]KAB8198406.1 hypothetical protein FKV24_002285 [Lysobacter maris]
MKAQDAVDECLKEFARVQPNGVLDASQLPRDGRLPAMLRAENSKEIWFSSRALECVNWLGRLLHQELKVDGVIRVEEFSGLVRKALVDGYCDGRLVCGDSALLEGIRQMLAVSLDAAKRSITHSFPAWSVELGGQALQVGPATIYPLAQWLRRQQFSARVGAAFFTPELPEAGWKVRFEAYLSGELEQQHVDPACMLADAVGDCSHVVVVTMPPMEGEISRQQARLLAQAALDVIALIFESPMYHRRWILRDQPSAPECYGEVSAFDFALSVPSAPKHDHRSPFSARKNAEALGRRGGLVEAAGQVLDAVQSSDPDAVNIDSARRWFTALMWAGQGAREPNDAIASTQFASSLDILARANGYHPILEMACGLLGVSPEAVVTRSSPSHRSGMTLRQVVKCVYGRGRSQVLHGSIVNPMDRHAVEREMGGFLARACLREAVLVVPKMDDRVGQNFWSARSSSSDSESPV